MRQFEFKTVYDLGYTDKNGWTVEAEENWREYSQARDAHWAWMRGRRFHALPEDKGIPVSHTGKRKRRKCTNGAGVSASSRVLSHYYADEGDKGRWVRKVVRNRERALWLSEWQDEQDNQGDPYGYDWTDYLRLTDPQDYVYPAVYTTGVTTLDESQWDMEDDNYSDYTCGDTYCDMCSFIVPKEHTEYEERYGCDLPDCVECYR
jgi:hypothetical protein